MAKMLPIALAVAFLAALAHPAAAEVGEDIYADISGAGKVAFAVVFAIGVLFLFFGYRVFKVTLFIIGFIIGAGITWAGFSIANPEVYGDAGNHADGIMTGVIASIIVGIGCGACAIALYLLGIFLIGFSLGLFAGIIGTAFIFGKTHIHYGEGSSSTATIIILCCAIAGGLAALKIQKVLIILATSFGGASQVVLSSVCFVAGQSIVFTDGVPSPPYAGANLTVVSYNIIVVCLAAVGAVIQFKVTGKGDHHSRNKDKVIIVNQGGGGGGAQTTVVNTIVQAPAYQPPPATYVTPHDPYGRVETGYAASSGDYHRMA